MKFYAAIAVYVVVGFLTYGHAYNNSDKTPHAFAAAQMSGLFWPLYWAHYPVAFAGNLAGNLAIEVTK